MNPQGINGIEIRQWLMMCSMLVLVNGWIDIQHGRVQYVHQATSLGHYIVDWLIAHGSTVSPLLLSMSTCRPTNWRLLLLSFPPSSILWLFKHPFCSQLAIVLVSTSLLALAFSSLSFVIYIGLLKVDLVGFTQDTKKQKHTRTPEPTILPCLASKNITFLLQCKKYSLVL